VIDSICKESIIILHQKRYGNLLLPIAQPQKTPRKRNINLCELCGLDWTVFDPELRPKGVSSQAVRDRSKEEL